MASTFIEITSISPADVSVFDYEASLTISWTIGPNQITNPSYVPTQASAQLRWDTGDENYHYINISGSTQSTTVAANTFPASGSIYFLLDVTDVSGTTNYIFFTYYGRKKVELNLTGGATVQKYKPDETFPVTGVINSTGSYSDNRALLMFEAAPSAQAYRAIFNAGIYSRTFPSNNGAGSVISGYIYSLISTFDPSTVTWNNMPGIEEELSGWNLPSDGTTRGTMQQVPKLMNDMILGSSKSRSAAEMATANGLMVTGPSNFGSSNSRHLSFYEPITLRLWFLDQTVTSKPAAKDKATGYVDPNVAQTFRWDLVPSGEYWCYGSWTQVSATFYWRNGTSGAWTSSSISGSTQEKTLAASTMGTGTVQWYVTTTDNRGTTASSDVYTITTGDMAHIATPITPAGTLENADASIRFTWMDSSETGALPSGADLDYSEDGETWTTFGQPRTSDTYYDAPGGTLPSGTVYWRVRSLNADGVAGEWSSPLSFLCFASPDPPVVTTDGKPLLTVTWQSIDQQAYDVNVDGVTYGPYFGSVRNFQTPEYLTDGPHNVSVRVQNKYGLWSEPGSAAITVTNVPGAPISLRGIFNRDAELSWTSGNVGEFVIYRDDVRIGLTTGMSFTDRTCLGYHSWKVVAKLQGGYYTTSNTISGELAVSSLTIAALTGGTWLELAKSANSDRSVNWNQSQNVSIRQFAGQEYPQAEISPHRSMSASFDVAWTYDEADQASAFADLIGRAVILKTPCEGVLVGILTGWQRDNTQFFKAYTCTVQRIHWRDYTDADN